MLNKLQAVVNKYEELCFKSEQPDFYADPNLRILQQEKEERKNEKVYVLSRLARRITIVSIS